ncbi:aromatic compound dioxygenase [Patellaria atrata CBS 101060]|uniref:Aromatic compound dioxygenase n=1 Tax=Patellaria atrata CBS 101060 TaxID=1346257 RepID=A0A9P4SAL2_9PEZI|nr:aromatic compound dioxygenase [Patellaria atrata CBS 101060]
MFRVIGAIALAAALLSSTSFAHPGHDHKHEAAQRREYIESLEQKDLGHCAETLMANGHYERAIKRRAETVARLRREAGIDHAPMLHARDINKVLNTNHRSNNPWNAQTPDSTVFGSNKSCILAPEIIEGPYYVSGEVMRTNIVENEKGVPLTLDLQLIDTTTCQPIPTAHLEIWSCNSTGVYSGVAGQGNGNANDLNNLKNTALRGFQAANSDGVVTFDTLVPGHYAGRANHIHVVSHIGATIRANNTLQGGTISHIGQIYFDQSLIDSINTIAPYSTNRIAKTPNRSDSWMAQGAATGDDDVINYVVLGNQVQEGLFGWITLGMDPRASRRITPAAWYGEGGGIKNPAGSQPGPVWPPPWGGEAENREAEAESKVLEG